jgi:branched-chain amino acid transport system substrate-binding protein
MLLGPALPGFAAGADEGIPVASIYAFSGKAADASLGSIQGVRFGVKEVNRHGGVHGRPLRLLELDNRSTPIGSKVAAEEAARAGVNAIVGPAWSSHSLAVARVAQAKRIPMITNIATHPAVTRVGHCIFRTCFTDGFQGRVMASFAREHLKARTAIVFVDLLSDYSMNLAGVFATQFEQLEGQILDRIDYKHTPRDFGVPIRTTVELQPDVVFLSGHDESGLIIKMALEAGFKGIPLGGDGWDVPAFFRHGAFMLPHGYFSTHWDKGIQTEASRRFVASFQGQGTLGSPAALGFDTVWLLAEAMRRAASLERGTICRALAQTSGHEGVTGAITFDRFGDPIKPAVIMQIIKGRKSYLMTVEDR